MHTQHTYSVPGNYQGKKKNLIITNCYEKGSGVSTDSNVMGIIPNLHVAGPIKYILYIIPRFSAVQNDVLGNSASAQASAATARESVVMEHVAHDAELSGDWNRVFIHHSQKFSLQGKQLQNGLGIKARATANRNQHRRIDVY